MDTFISSEIHSILGLYSYDLDDAVKSRRMQEVVQYFSKQENWKYHLLKTLQGKQGDKLDIAWSWVALQNEKRTIIDNLMTHVFPNEEEDILAGIEMGGREAIQKVREKVQDSIDTQSRNDIVRTRKEDIKRGEAESRATDEATIANLSDAQIDVRGLKDIQNNLNILDKVNADLSEY